METLAAKCPWYVAGPLLGLVMVGLRWAANRPLGALGGYAETLQWLRRPSSAPGWRVFFFAGIVGGVVAVAVKYSPNAIFIIVSNPLDVMTYLAWKKSGLPAERVFGMAGELDSARMAYFIAEALSCNPSDVQAMVLGGHGDEMVPVPQHTKVKGKPITELLPADKIEAINQRTRDGGAEIVKYLKTGSAYYAPSSSVVRMVRAVLEDKGEVIAFCVYMTG